MMSQWCHIALYRQRTFFKDNWREIVQGWVCYIARVEGICWFGICIDNNNCTKHHLLEALCFVTNWKILQVLIYNRWCCCYRHSWNGTEKYIYTCETTLPNQFTLTDSISSKLLCFVNKLITHCKARFIDLRSSHIWNLCKTLY